MSSVNRIVAKGEVSEGRREGCFEGHAFGISRLIEVDARSSWEELGASYDVYGVQCVWLQHDAIKQEERECPLPFSDFSHSPLQPQREVA